MQFEDPFSEEDQKEFALCTIIFAGLKNIMKLMLVPRGLTEQRNCGMLQ